MQRTLSPIEQQDEKLAPHPHVFLGPSTTVFGKCVCGLSSPFVHLLLAARQFILGDLWGAIAEVRVKRMNEMPEEMMRTGVDSERQRAHHTLMSHDMPDDSRDEEFRAKLSPEQYAVARQCGTERAFSGAYWDEKRPGVYRCICCDTELFSSEHKYDSGSGWPSYYQPMENANVREIPDNTHGMRRIEVRCAKCDAHLGHVFPDGPAPTRTRYCINSASLAFNPNEGE